MTRPLFRFTIRDVLLAMTIVGLAIGWVALAAASVRIAQEEQKGARRSTNACFGRGSHCERPQRAVPT